MGLYNCPNQREFVEICGVFDRIDRINLLLSKDLKKIQIFRFLLRAICTFD